MKAGMIMRVGKSVAAFALVGCCLAGAGCASLDAASTRYDVALSAPLPPGRARVCFVRKSSLLGAIVTHYVMDCGSNVEFDSKIIERGQITYGDVMDTGRRTITITAGRVVEKNETIDLKSLGLRTVTVTEKQMEMPPNTDRMGHVHYLVLPLQAAFDELMASSGGFPSVVRRMGEVIVPIYSGSFMGSERTSVSIDVATVSDATDAIRPNARYAGAVRSGGSLIYDRPAGDLRFKVVTPGGDEAFSPVFPVENGKKYLVEYAYGLTGVHFSLFERP